MLPLAMIGARLSPWAARGLIAGAVLALIVMGAWGSLVAYRGALDDARAAGRAERDAHWRAELAVSNAKVEAERADAARRAADAEAAIGQLSTRLTETLQQMEAANATLPNGDACGLDRDRVRLLPR